MQLKLGFFAAVLATQLWAKPMLVLRADSYVDIALDASDIFLNVAAGGCGIVLRTNRPATSHEDLWKLKTALAVEHKYGDVPLLDGEVGRFGLRYRYTSDSVYGTQLRIMTRSGESLRKEAGQARIIATLELCEN